jgi:predicted small secreted protein
MKHNVCGALRLVGSIAVLASTLAVNGCNTSVGVGMSVGVPVGNHGYVSVGGTRWH